MIKKILLLGLLTFGSQLDAITTVMNHRLITSSPLLYKQDDYSYEQLSFEMEPFVSHMFDPAHTMSNLGIDGRSFLLLNQEGFGDVNPAWILLGSNNEDANYSSVVNLLPELSMFGVTMHLYKQFENFFFDVKTALTNCKTIINLDEIGGGNGGLAQPDGTIVYTAYDAFTQADWQYGKMGESQSMIRLDNIQLEFGLSTHMSSFSSQRCTSYFAGFLIVEIPTGKGTQATWLFEPQVGTNHWAFGFGADYMLASDNGFSLVLGGNFRHPIANWETRSFDLTENGQWSRYLALQQISEIGSGPVAGLPGINVFTQDALVSGRDQITAYARLQKQFQHCLFELSYNYLYAQQETIKQINGIPQGYGIYNISNGGGANTASQAHIYQAAMQGDGLGISPVSIHTSDINLSSGAMSYWMSNSIAARLQILREGYTMGIGGMVDLAASAQAISTWTVWLNFEILLPE